MKITEDRMLERNVGGAGRKLKGYHASLKHGIITEALINKYPALI